MTLTVSKMHCYKIIKTCHLGLRTVLSLHWSSAYAIGLSIIFQFNQLHVQNERRRAAIFGSSINPCSYAKQDGAQLVRLKEAPLHALAYINSFFLQSVNPYIWRRQILELTSEILFNNCHELLLAFGLRIKRMNLPMLGISQWLN